MPKQPPKQAEPKPAAKPAWSVPVAITDVPESGRRIELVADAPAREAIAKVAGLIAVPRLVANFDLSRQGDDGLRVAGSVTADVVQTCVVTLEPMQSEIDEPIDLVFTASATPVRTPQSIEADDPPENLRNGVADLGAVATEFLLLGIDPYPRKPDAVFDAPAEDDSSNRPFAALAALKKAQDPKEG
jgi:uncharacterized metal-binding protein YceD (DUF177 family)